MYNLRSNRKDTVRFPVQIEVADDDQFSSGLLNHKAASTNDSVNISSVSYDSLMKVRIVTLTVML